MKSICTGEIPTQAGTCLQFVFLLSLLQQDQQYKNKHRQKVERDRLSIFILDSVTSINMHPLSVICGVQVLNTSNFLLIQRKRAITIPAKLNKTSWKIYCVSQTMIGNKKFKFWEETAGGNHKQEYANGLLSDFPLITVLHWNIKSKIGNISVETIVKCLMTSANSVNLHNGELTEPEIWNRKGKQKGG